MAAQPSPLPIPQPAAPQNPLAESLAAIQKAVPNIDPQVATGIAQGVTNPADAVTTAQGTQGYVDTTNTMNYLRQQSSTNQIAAWKQFSATEQQMLKTAGYKPPSQHRSLFGSITHDLGEGVHDVLNAAGSPLRAVQHVERTLLAPPRSGAEAGFWGNLFSPQNWADAWNQTSNGEHYIQPRVQQQVQKQFGDQIYQLAYQIATGGNPANIVAAAPAAQQQQVAQQIQSDPQLHQAVSMLQAGHLSVGRMLAQDLQGSGHGALFNTISGVTDGVLDWFGDPLVVGAKSANAGRVARYFVQNADDVQRVYDAVPSVKSAFSDIASHVAAGNFTELVQRYPQLAGMVDSLRNADTAEKVLDTFKDSANLTAIIAGKAASLPGAAGEGGILPHLSFMGQKRLEAKGVLQHSIDWMADTPARIEGLQPGDTIEHPLNAGGMGAQTRLVTASGQFLRKLTTLTPTGHEFVANDPNWFTNLRNILLMGLTRDRTENLLNEYAAAGTLAQRREIYASALKEVMAGLGVDRVPGVSEWVDAALDPNAPQSILSHQAYAPNGNDIITRAGRDRPAGILRGDMTEVWKMPDFRTLYAQSKKLGIMRATNGAINNTMVDKFMQEAWKPLALARFGFAVRVAGEEAFGALLRANPTALLRSRAAGSMLHQQTLASDPELHGRLASTWGWLTAHLPAAAQARIVSPTDLIVEHLGDATSRAMAKTAGVFAGAKYRNAVRVLAENGILDADGAFGRYASASETNGGTFYDQFMGDVRSQKVWNHGKWVSMRLAPTGGFTQYDNTAQVFTNFWYKRLHNMANDAWARTAMQTRNEPLADRLQKLAEQLKNDPAWARSERSLGTQDGRMVATGDATRDEVALDHAKVIIDLVDHLTHDQYGDEIPGLVDHLLANHKPPTVAALDTIDEDLRPASVTGPEMGPALDGLTGAWTKGVNRMFAVIGKQIDWISRQPMFIHNFTASLDAYKPMVRTWERMGMNPEDVQHNLTMAATDRALKMTLPYIHNPELRSQFEVVTRNVAPFMFAQEQFYKRWARTMSFAPWAFRQAQLINQGVYHSGFTHTDPTTGQRYFIYPGAGAVQDVLARSITAMGGNAFLPIEANLRGQVKMASPGLERIGLPSLGPLVVVPMKFVQGLFPEIAPEIQGVEGQQAASASYVSSLVPTTVSRIWQDFTSSASNSQQFASAMMQAIQYLEATGHGIGTPAVTNMGTFNGLGHPNVDGKPGDYITDQAGKVWVVQQDGQWRENDPAALTAYMSRVKNWTRVFLITRTIFGFNMPASPENLFDPGHVNEDLQTLLKELPYQEAIAAFMKIHPDASAYTVFQTKNQAGSALPATSGALQFMDANSGFFSDHRLAGSFFIPAQATSGKFDLQAYRAQLQEQLRVRRTPQEFWQEIAYQNAATPYFNAETMKNQMMSQGRNYNVINRAWTEQSQQFFKTNPLFAQQLEDQAGAYTRADIEQDLGAALNDPRLPETPQTEDIRALFNAWLVYQTETAPYASPSGNTISSAQRYALEIDFANQALAFLQEHPDAQPVFDRLMRPDLSSALNTQAQQVA